MSAQEENFLPKEPLDLPREHLDLPSPHSENSNHNEIKTLISWKAPGRPFRKRTKQYYLTALLIMLLIQIILFLFGQYVLMVVVVSLVFVSFTLASVPPHDLHYRISTGGVTIDDHFFLWQELYDYYFKKIEGIDVLHIRTHALIPGLLTIPIGDLDKEHVKTVILPYLPYREHVRPSSMEKAGDWLSKNFPLEKTS